MCKVIDDFVEQGIERGIEKGIEKGVETGTTANLKNLMRNMNLTLEQAMDILGIPNDKKKRYTELINA